MPGVEYSRYYSSPAGPHEREQLFELWLTLPRGRQIRFGSKVAHSPLAASRANVYSSYAMSARAVRLEAAWLVAYFGDLAAPNVRLWKP